MTNHSIEGSRRVLLATLLAAASCSDPSGETPTPPQTNAEAETIAAEAGPSDEKEVEKPAKERRRGRWVPLRAAAGGEAQDGSESNLGGLGYAGAYEEGGEFSGAIIRNADRIAPGLTLVCSGHDTSVLLMDVKGEIVHHWHIDFDEVFPDPLPFKAQAFHSEFIRRAWPFPNGNLLAIFEYTGITLVDAKGKPIWSQANRSHHDFKILEDGTIVTMDMEEWSQQHMREKYGAFHFHDGLIDSHLIFISPEGETLRKLSIFSAFYGSRYAVFLKTIRAPPADLFHANSVDVLDAATASAFPQFEKGDILVSLRNSNAVVVIDNKTEKVKWLVHGLFSSQHQASFLPNGRILLFDNAGGNESMPLVSDQSRVLEIDPKAQEVAWQFPRQNEDLDFFSAMLGYVERLPGGNTLITESMQGHLIEVAPDGEVVWEYYSPYRAGDNDELITTLMGARRIPRATLPFLDE